MEIQKLQRLYEIWKKDSDKEPTQFCCAECGAEWTVDDSVCPKCGSNHKLITAYEALDVYDLGLDLLQDDKKIYDGDHDHYKEIHCKLGFDRDTQQPCIEFRELNRTPGILETNQSYHEVFTTLNGDVINDKDYYKCLLDHRGYGSARKKKSKGS